MQRLSQSETSQNDVLNLMANMSDDNKYNSINQRNSQSSLNPFDIHDSMENKNNNNNNINSNTNDIKIDTIVNKTSRTNTIVIKNGNKSPSKRGLNHSNRASKNNDDLDDDLDDLLDLDPDNDVDNDMLPSHQPLDGTVIISSPSVDTDYNKSLPKNSHYMNALSSKSLKNKKLRHSLVELERKEQQQLLTLMQSPTSNHLHQTFKQVKSINLNNNITNNSTSNLSASTSVVPIKRVQISMNPSSNLPDDDEDTIMSTINASHGTLPRPATNDLYDSNQPPINFTPTHNGQITKFRNGFELNNNNNIISNFDKLNRDEQVRVLNDKINLLLNEMQVIKILQNKILQSSNISIDNSLIKNNIKQPCIASKSTSHIQVNIQHKNTHLTNHYNSEPIENIAPDYRYNIAFMVSQPMLHQLGSGVEAVQPLNVVAEEDELLRYI